MKGALGLFIFALALAPTGARAACDGPHLAVKSVSLKSVGQTRHLHFYHVAATVTNDGNQAQPGNALTFVDVVLLGTRLDDRGIPPLAPGQSYTVSYTWPRSADAGDGTTPLDFRLRFIAPSSPENCTLNQSAGIWV